MTPTVRRDWPRGFGGAVENHAALLSASDSVLRLPAQAVVDGPFLRIPEGEFDQIVVESFCEGFGTLEAFASELVTRLAPGGRLLVDALHQQSPRQLRVTLEGKANCLDPAGSKRWPEVPLEAGRLLRAFASAGVLLEDLYQLPHPDQLDAEFVRTMIALGFMAARYAAGSPAARLWLTAANQPRNAGTVIVGPSADAATQRRTVASVEAIVPAAWRVEACAHDPETAEHVAINRAVARSDGDLIWILRAGGVVDAQSFHELVASSTLAPSMPPTPGGDIHALMIAREQLLRVGPIAERWAVPSIAYDDFGLRIESLVRRVRLVAEASSVVAPPLTMEADQATYEGEAKALLELWDGVGHVEDPILPGARTRVQAERALQPAPWEGRAPRVTLCMITRDEERFLDECLTRAASAVDEIVIVDTGSTDRTVEIAERHGAKVIHEEWQDDFARPRNTGLQHATGDWVFVLDADEFLEEGSAEVLRELVQDAKVCGYHLRFTNVYDEEKTLGVTMVRLFRNLPGLEWINRIHEQVTPSLLSVSASEGLVLSSGEVHVLHYGYGGSIMDSKGKLERNERLFEMQIAEHPDDIYSLYKFGDFLRRCPGRDSDARATLERTLELIETTQPGCPRSIPYAGEVAALVALEYARQERWDEAEQVIERGLRRFMVTPNLHYIAAGIALHRGRPDEAISHYQACLGYRGQTLVVPIQDGITGHVSLTGIAHALLQKGDRENARRLLEQAVRLEPDHDVTSMVLSRLHLEDGDLRRALSVLTSHLERNPDSAGVCQQTTLLLAQLGLKDQALRMGQRAIELLEADASEIEANQMRKTLAAIAE